MNYNLDATNIYIDLESILNHYKAFKHIQLTSFLNEGHLYDCRLRIKEYRNLIKSRSSLNPDKSFLEFKKDLIHNINVENESIKEGKVTARAHYLKYIQIIKQSKDESIDDGVISELNYLYFKNKQYSPLISLLLNSVGYFYKPSRAILLSVYMIVIFGIAFYSINNFGCRFLTLSEISTPSALSRVAADLINSIYFSGITFFTIGYSDIIGESVSTIEPIRKVLILLEAGLGIILTSTILLSFMNKYLSRK